MTPPRLGDRVRYVNGYLMSLPHLSQDDLRRLVGKRGTFDGCWHPPFDRDFALVAWDGERPVLVNGTFHRLQHIVPVATLERDAA